MKNLRIHIFSIVALFISFMLGFVPAQYLINKHYLSKFKIFYWDEDPTLIICPSSNYKEDQVIKSLEFWKEKGHYVGIVHKDSKGEICKSKRLNGFIFIRGDVGGVGPDSYAVTRRHTDRAKLVFAELQVPNSNIDMPLLLEHELGHAFGFTHLNDNGHIMNESYHLIGKKFYYPK